MVKGQQVDFMPTEDRTFEAYTVVTFYLNISEYKPPPPSERNVGNIRITAPLQCLHYWKPSSVVVTLL